MQNNRSGLKKSTVVVLVISIALMLCGTGIAVAGIALGGITDLDGVRIGGHEVVFHGAEDVAESTVGIESFTNMDIQANGSQVIFVDDTDWYVKARYYEGDEPLIDVQDGTLYIKDYMALSGDSVSLVGDGDGPAGIHITDGSGNDVTLSGDGIDVKDEDGTRVTINGLGITVNTDEDIDEDDIDHFPINIDISGLDSSYSYEVPSIEIHCPFKETYGTMMLNTSWADSVIDGMTLDTVTLNMESGNIQFKNSTIGKVEGVQDYGYLQFDNSTLESLKLTSDNTTVTMHSTTVKDAVTLDIGAINEGHAFENCTLGALTINCDSLTLDLDHTTVTGKTVIKGSYGDVNIQESTLAGLEANMEDFALEFSGTLTGETVIKTEGNEIELTIDGNEKDYRYALNTEEGTATVNDKPYKASVSENKAPNTIQVDMEYGDISLNFR